MRGIYVSDAELPRLSSGTNQARLTKNRSRQVSLIVVVKRYESLLDRYAATTNGASKIPPNGEHRDAIFALYRFNKMLKNTHFWFAVRITAQRNGCDD